MREAREDPLVRSARREAACALGLWSAAFLYSVSYCYAFGYGGSAEDLTLVWGVPSWAFWGLIVPWCACTAASMLFAAFIMTDDPLGDEDPTHAGAGAPEPPRTEEADRD
jgi:hypothetical protein